MGTDMRAIRVGPGPRGYGVMSDAEILLLAHLTQAEAVEVVQSSDAESTTRRGRPWVPSIRMPPEREDANSDVDYMRKTNRSIQTELAMRESQ